MADIVEDMRLVGLGRPHQVIGRMEPHRVDGQQPLVHQRSEAGADQGDLGLYVEWVEAHGAEALGSRRGQQHAQRQRGQRRVNRADRGQVAGQPHVGGQDEMVTQGGIVQELPR